MAAIYEGRTSDSPYIHTLWRGELKTGRYVICPADVCWNLLFVKHGRSVRVKAEGAASQHVLRRQMDDSEFLVIKFHLGVFMPHLPASRLLNGDACLPDASGHSFWLKGGTWAMPTFENAEVFVQRLFREGIIAREAVVTSAASDADLAYSSRTIRRRYLHATGLTPTQIDQISRAQQAMALLEAGRSILDVVHATGYADQPHLTRALRRLVGYTPGQIAQMSTNMNAPA